jgi:ribosome biogenesis GTPase A
LVRHVFRLLQRAIDDRRPVQWVLLENVRALLEQLPGKQPPPIDPLVATLERLGYRSWAYRVLCSGGFGVPARRRRVFVLASRDGDARDVLLSQGAARCLGGCVAAARLRRAALAEKAARLAQAAADAVARGQSGERAARLAAEAAEAARSAAPSATTANPLGRCFECYDPKGPRDDDDLRGDEDARRLRASFALDLGNARTAGCVDCLPTLTTGNRRICLLLPDGRMGLLRTTDAERVQGLPPGHTGNCYPVVHEASVGGGLGAAAAAAGGFSAFYADEGGGGFGAAKEGGGGGRARRGPARDRDAEARDRRRFALVGNSVTVQVARWIGERLAAPYALKYVPAPGVADVPLPEECQPSFLGEEQEGGGAAVEAGAAAATAAAARARMLLRGEQREEARRGVGTASGSALLVPRATVAALTGRGGALLGREAAAAAAAAAAADLGGGVASEDEKEEEDEHQDQAGGGAAMAAAAAPPAAAPQADTNGNANTNGNNDDGDDDNAALVEASSDADTGYRQQEQDAGEEPGDGAASRSRARAPRPRTRELLLPDGGAGAAPAAAAGEATAPPSAATPADPSTPAAARPARVRAPDARRERSYAWPPGGWFLQGLGRHGVRGMSETPLKNAYVPLGDFIEEVGAPPPGVSLQTYLHRLRANGWVVDRTARRLLRGGGVMAAAAGPAAAGAGAAAAAAAAQQQQGQQQHEHEHEHEAADWLGELVWMPDVHLSGTAAQVARRVARGLARDFRADLEAAAAAMAGAAVAAPPVVAAPPAVTATDKDKVNDDNDDNEGEGEPTRSPSLDVVVVVEAAPAAGGGSGAPGAAAASRAPPAPPPASAPESDNGRPPGLSLAVLERLAELADDPFSEEEEQREQQQQQRGGGGGGGAGAAPAETAATAATAAATPAASVAVATTIGGGGAPTEDPEPQHEQQQEAQQEQQEPQQQDARSALARALPSPPPPPLPGPLPFCWPAEAIDPWHPPAGFTFTDAHLRALEEEDVAAATAFLGGDEEDEDDDEEGREEGDGATTGGRAASHAPTRPAPTPRVPHLPPDLLTRAEAVLEAARAELLPQVFGPDGLPRRRRRPDRRRERRRAERAAAEAAAAGVGAAVPAAATAAPVPPPPPLPPPPRETKRPAPLADRKVLLKPYGAAYHHVQTLEEQARAAAAGGGGGGGADGGGGGIDLGGGAYPPPFCWVWRSALLPLELRPPATSGSDGQGQGQSQGQNADPYGGKGAAVGRLQARLAEALEAAGQLPDNWRRAALQAEADLRIKYGAALAMAAPAAAAAAAAGVAPTAPAAAAAAAAASPYGAVAAGNVERALAGGGGGAGPGGGSGAAAQISGRRSLPAPRVPRCGACDTCAATAGRSAGRRCLVARAAAAAAAGHVGGQLAALGEAAVGARVRLWWQLEDAWFDGTVSFFVFFWFGLFWGVVRWRGWRSGSGEGASRRPPVPLAAAPPFLSTRFLVLFFSVHYFRRHLLRSRAHPFGSFSSRARARRHHPHPFARAPPLSAAPSSSFRLLSKPRAMFLLGRGYLPAGLAAGPSSAAVNRQAAAVARAAGGGGGRGGGRRLSSPRKRPPPPPARDQQQQPDEDFLGGEDADDRRAYAREINSVDDIGLATGLAKQVAKMPAAAAAAAAAVRETGEAPAGAVGASAWSSRAPAPPPRAPRVVVLPVPGDDDDDDGESGPAAPPRPSRTPRARGAAPGNPTASRAATGRRAAAGNPSSAPSALAPGAAPQPSDAALATHMVQWYPGHIARAERQLREQLRMVDVVLEVRDARIPAATRHPQVAAWCAGKPRLVLINRADSISRADRRAWDEHFRAGAKEKVFWTDGQRGRGVGAVRRAALRVGERVNAKRAARGLRPRPVRACVIGFPNIGKSALINRLLGRRVVESAARPGVTRTLRWVRLGQQAVAGASGEGAAGAVPPPAPGTGGAEAADRGADPTAAPFAASPLDLLDAPGVIPASFGDQVAAQRLAMCDDIGEAAYLNSLVAAALVARVKRLAAPSRGALAGAARGALRQLERRFRLDARKMTGEAFVARAAADMFGGDVEQAGARVLNDYRAGRLGNLALEAPEDDKGAPTAAFVPAAAAPRRGAVASSVSASSSSAGAGAASSSRGDGDEEEDDDGAFLDEAEVAELLVGEDLGTFEDDDDDDEDGGRGGSGGDDGDDK